MNSRPPGSEDALLLEAMAPCEGVAHVPRSNQSLRLACSLVIGMLRFAARAETMKRAFGGAFLCGIIGALSASAHDPGISMAQGDLRADSLTLTTGFAPADIEQLLAPSTPRPERWGQEEFDVVRQELLALAPTLWDVQAGDARSIPREVHVELLPGDNVSFRLVFPRSPGGEMLTLRAPRLPDLPSGHRQFVVISDDRGSVITKKLLSTRDMTIDVPLAVSPGLISSGAATPQPVAESTTAWEFIKLGVEHIWTGYDHLLFLFALLVVCRTFGSIVAIISCFTVAHSLTLALATLNVVNLPARFVETAIAASIIFVGVENLWRRGEEPRGRWALTLAFGLIHGFGFASVLRDLGVGSGSSGIMMPLVTFNLGVELGQIVIAAAVLPIVWQLRKREGFVRVGVPAFSILVALAGLYWMLQRTLFS